MSGKERLPRGLRIRESSEELAWYHKIKWEVAFYPNARQKRIVLTVTIVLIVTLITLLFFKMNQVIMSSWEERLLVMTSKGAI